MIISLARNVDHYLPIIVEIDKMERIRSKMCKHASFLEACLSVLSINVSNILA